MTSGLMDSSTEINLMRDIAYAEITSTVMEHLGISWNTWPNNRVVVGTLVLALRMTQ
jgi:hypothetical protein